MLKRILVPLEEHDHSRTAIEYAVNLASSGNIMLTALFTVDIPSIEKSIGPVPVGGTYYAQQEEKQRINEEKKVLAKIMQEFEDICKAKKIQYELKEDEGNAENIIIEESKYHDLIIIGHHTSFKYGSGKDKKLHHGLIGHGISPVVVIPPKFNGIKKILICYDGSIQAAKTVHEFVQSGIWKNREVILLTVNDEKDKGLKLLDRISGYMTPCCSANFEKVCIKGNQKNVIVNYIKKNDIDLVVLGAYGKNAIHHFFFGSTTDIIFEKTELPLFMYH